MRVKLRNDWFAPNGTLYRVVDNPHNLPDDWKDNLPKSARVMEAKDGVDYGKLQERLTKEHDPLAVDNANLYKWPQPDDNLLAPATPSNPADDESEEDRAKREEEAKKREEEEAEKRKQDASAARKKELEAMSVAQLHTLTKTNKVDGVESDDNKSSLVTKILAHENNA